MAKTRISISLEQDQAERIRQHAEPAGTDVSAYLVHALSGVLKDCAVPHQARTSEPPMRETKAGCPECLDCATDPDLADWRCIGTTLGRASPPAKERLAAVDAWVALAAGRHGSAVIFTIEPGDTHAYLKVLAPMDVRVVAV
ncbi:hypothetical protein NX794_01600 [Streptomyces sp. LP11]|uniref:CopG family transcriptional regulator n=1 Tax=Streptomyces pyxinicus TaxID=2970331 RepID=A0ABT2AUW7_9ACTN|nr:hypothetical protein [Streptomyces sp. LP11]